MTAPAATAADVEPVIAGALQLLTDKPEAKLDDLAAAVLPVPVPETGAPAVSFPDLPKPVELSDDALKALRTVKAVFGKVRIGERRALTEQELAGLTAEVLVLRDLAPVLGARLEEIKETIRVHMDVDSEKKGAVVPADLLDPADGSVLVAATPRDQNGHYLQCAPKKPHEVQSGNVVWSQQYSSGSASPSGAVLKQLFEAGEISRADYLAMTREERVFDADKTRAFIRRNPMAGLKILKRITTRKAPSASLYLRDVK